VGRPAHSWRTAEAGIRDRRVDRFQVHDAAARAAIADLADIPAQSWGSHRSDRSLPGSDHDLRVPVCVSDCEPRSTPAALVCGDAASNGEWLAQQVVEAFPWETAPTYLVRDNDGAYGPIFTGRVRAMGIRDRPIAPRSPWQNPYVERLIGTLRRDCLDHVLILGERHLRRVLTLYSQYYNDTRTHLSLAKDAPLGRAIQRSGTIVAIPILSGLHHCYARI
jgi:hypothetical protein